MKFDVTSAQILTPAKIEIDSLRIRSYGASFYDHNYGHQDFYAEYEWKLDLKDGMKFKASEVPYLRGMSFIITDLFTTFLVRCYTVEKIECSDGCGKGDKYFSLTCQDVDNIEFLEGAKRTDTYIDIFNPNFKGQLPELDNTL